MGRAFERKWLDRDEAINVEALEAPDFSATTDLYQIVSNVCEMKSFPFGLKNLTSLIVVTLLPFLPVALAAIPLEVILKGITKLLL